MSRNAARKGPGTTVMSALAALRVIERGARTVLTTFFTLLGSSNNDEDESSENVTKK